MIDGLKDRHRAAIIAAIAANPRVERAVLFGSRATGTYTADSDVDIALFGDGLTLTDQARLGAIIDDIPMAQSVDLILYRFIDNSALLDHIRAHGVVWHRRRGSEKTDRLHLLPRYRRALEALLRKHLPDVEVWAYGSRVNGRSHDDSDLDLVLRSPGLVKIDISQLAEFNEAVQESTVPFLIEARDWARLPERFQREIEGEHVVLVEGKQCASDQWREVTIGEVADVVGGSTPSTKSPGNFDGDIPWLTPKDLSVPHNRYVERGERNLSRKGLKSCSARLLPTGSVLLSTRAPIGYVALAKNPIATNQGFRSLVCKEEASAEYIYYWLIQNTEVLKRHASGSTFQELSGTSLKNLHLRLPPLPEQRAIAHILGTLDDKIELNRRMNETLEAMARALFKSWFVDFDPVRAKAALRPAKRTSSPPKVSDGTDKADWPAERARAYLDRMDPEIAALFPDRFVDSGLGEIPEGWEVSTIGQEVNVVGGSTPSTKERSYWDGSIRWATPKDLSRLASPVLMETARRITEQGLGKISSGLLARGTVLLSSRAPIGYVAIADVPVAINQGFIAMKCRQRLAAMYVWLWIEANMDGIKEHANGSTFQEINKRNFRKLPAIVPHESVRRAHNQLGQSLYDRIVKNERESHFLGAIRGALLPNLISGEIRVPDAEAEKAEAAVA